MIIQDATPQGKTAWNAFITENYPPIGAFMQSWEWGEFQVCMGRNIGRKYIMENNTPIGAYMYTRHILPLGFSYQYAPRGPVIAKNASENQCDEAFKTLQGWANGNLPHDIFFRLEPPLKKIPALNTTRHGYALPKMYTQPRYNLALSLKETEEEIINCLHPSTRSNLARAKRRGVSIEHARAFTPETHTHFMQMMKDTIARNSGVNAYPGARYFDAFFKTIPFFTMIHGLVNGEPAATHIVLYFSNTATYLYGAAYSKHLSSKVTTVLHMESALEAKRRGMQWYDMGGIDEKRWPTLTDFKRQFRGTEFSYIGNIDMVLKPAAYALYTAMKKLRA